MTKPATLLDRARAAIEALGYAQREDLGCTTRQFRDLARTMRDAGEARTEEVLLAPAQRPAYTANQLRVLHAWRESRTLPLALIVARSGLSEPTVRKVLRELRGAVSRFRGPTGARVWRCLHVQLPPLHRKIWIAVSTAERDRIAALPAGSRIPVSTYADHRVMGQLEREGITAYREDHGKVFWYRTGRDSR